MAYSIESFPPTIDLETPEILKQLSISHRYLAELKGVCYSIPNQAILINTIALQEAKDSSEVENIITTHDELFRESVFPNEHLKGASKEVKNYVFALHKGFELVRDEELLTNKHILEIQKALEKNKAGFRRLPGTELRNDKTGQTVYVPPQHNDDIVRLMTQLEYFINMEQNIDPLVKMALIHHQFESIHPFYDGNGRTGRIINVLYLVLSGLLDIPVLYLSRYVVKNKAQYAELLQSVRDDEAWEAWTLYILKAIEVTAKQSLNTVNQIREAMLTYKHKIRSEFNFYSQDLINHLFFHPYTKIDFLQSALKISRPTATKYLDELVQSDLLHKEKMGRSNYYVNKALYQLLSEND